MAYIKRILLLLLIPGVFLSFFLLNTPAAFASVNNSDTSSFDLDSSWEYHLGKLSTNASGIPLWTQEDKSRSNWIKFKFHGQIPQNVDSKDIWVRLKLPEVKQKNLQLFLKTLDQSIICYENSQVIYQYPSDASPNRKQLMGYSNHFIPLNSDYPAKYLYIKMSSFDKNNLGVIRGARLGSQTELITFIVQNDLPNVILSSLFCFIGLILFFFFTLMHNEDKSPLTLGLFSLCIGIWSVTQTDIKLLLYDNPVAWFYIDVISLYLIPVGLCAYVTQIFKTKLDFILKYLWQLFVLNTIMVLILDTTNIVPLYSTLGIFYLLLGLTMVVLVAAIIKTAFEGNIDARIFAGGLLFLCIFAIYDILGSYVRVIPWYKNLTPWGMLIFVLALSLILGKRFAEVYKKLKDYSFEIETKNEALNHMFIEVKSSKDKIARWSEGLEQSVMEKTAAIRNLLNNAGQGFLSFGRDLTINREYSHECVNIFDSEIEGKNISDLLYAHDEEQKIFFTELVKKILTENDESKRDIFLTLLPDEVMIGKKHIQVSYKIINENPFEKTFDLMFVLTDITEKRILETKMEQEKNNLRMVVKIIVYFNDFVECAKDYKNFCENKMNQILNSRLTLKEKVFEIFRNIHTFKGCFSQLEMIQIVHYLNDFESEISNFSKNIDKSTLKELKSFISGFRMLEWFEMDLSTLKGILGEGFFKQENTIRIEKSQLLEIETKVKTILPPFECRLLLPFVKRLWYKPFNELLKSYPEHVERLSERLEKLINPLEIIGAEVLIDIDKYTEFARSLIHIFRNVVDHGLESIDERIEAGKSEYGNIQCKISVSNDKIYISIKDDGRGLNVSEIRNKAIELGMIDNESAFFISDSEILEFIFKEGFTTKEIANELSGRGIGLSSVKSVVSKMGGKIEVNSKLNQGTEFLFILPYEEISEIKETTVSEFMSPIIETTIHLYNEQAGLKLSPNKDDYIEEVDFLDLKEVTTFISVRGILEGIFILSSDDCMMKNIIQSFITYNSILYNLPYSEDSFLVEDIISEFFNTVLGNSLKKFILTEDLISIETPITVCSQKGSQLKYPGSGIWTCDLMYESGALSVSFISSKGINY